MKDPAKDTIKISKMLSLVLRHKPESIGLTLDEQGWADVGLLIQKINNKGLALNGAVLQQVVATNNKKRFAYNHDKTKIRANQGHTIDVDLGYTTHTPPEILFHGTGSQFVSDILQQGLLKMNRHHVHLSADVETAEKVGQRKGKPVILQVASLTMFNKGIDFFVSANNVWLTHYVPPEYISILKPQ